MNILVVLPILIPFVTGIILILLWNHRTAQRVLSVAGSAALFVISIILLFTVWQDGILVMQMSNWPAPFGITLVADLLSAIMVVLAGLMAISVAIYSLASMDSAREAYGYHPLYQILLMGICGSFLTGDLFNLYVWFEVMLISSFVLVALGGEPNQLEGGIKYVTLNLISSAIFLAAVGLIYGLVGTLNMADLSIQLRQSDQPGLVLTLAMLFLIAFGLKAAVFPLFFWLPASYHTPPVAVSAIFSGLLTKVGVYTLIRVFTLLFIIDTAYTHTVLMVVAGLTMLTGVLGAASQNEFRRILSFHIVSQIGYMVMGLALYTPLAIAGAVFYITHHIVVKTNLFLVSGVVYRLRGTYQLKKLGGIYSLYPLLGVLFLIPAFSLAGIPPLSGFWAKFVLIRAGLEIGQYTIVAVALVVSLLTIFSMTKIWAEVFWKADPNIDPANPPENPSLGTLAGYIVPVVALAAVTITIGLFAEPFVQLAIAAADQLLDPNQYIQAVRPELLEGIVQAQ
ncbi:MAG TPA: Na+/H+ antiporter subunit D [Anaerolineae bacterium]|nr:Na+/H+ antiporter subunit D [Anaerolineae bacterium]MCB0178144.1 Na+/H+ antiporter subunit D [Anaerolineae bacterium]MCB0222178.1 Na+/H+ antiporter subunit D [Anaerolineae bacterium]MCB9102894.1 Na+/H+ antiporter subunit D [Anaerolineales bacterium]HRV95441.1 Na+/H+ antiporter subunit D [Anaerolineae bacterium]